MKYLAAGALIVCVGLSVGAAYIVGYGSVEFALVKKLAVSGWLFAGMICLVGLIRELEGRRDA